MSDFAGFPILTLRFLEGIRENNSKAWFDAHRGDYEAGYVAPAKAFVQACGARLREFAPAIVAEPKVNGSIFRINRDIRFSADKTPYKDHLDFWFWEGERRGAVSGFFARIAPDHVTVGAGCHGMDPSRLNAFRTAVGDHAAAGELLQLVTELERDGREVGGVALKRVPTGIDVVPGVERFLLHKALFSHVDEPVDSRLNSAHIVDMCAMHWRRMAPLHEWLIRHVQ